MERARAHRGTGQGGGSRAQRGGPRTSSGTRASGRWCSATRRSWRARAAAAPQPRRASEWQGVAASHASRCMHVSTQAVSYSCGVHASRCIHAGPMRSSASPWTCGRADCIAGKCLAIIACGVPPGAHRVPVGSNDAAGILGVSVPAPPGCARVGSASPTRPVVLRLTGGGVATPAAAGQTQVQAGQHRVVGGRTRTGAASQGEHGQAGCHCRPGPHSSCRTGSLGRTPGPGPAAARGSLEAAGFTGAPRERVELMGSVAQQGMAQRGTASDSDEAQGAHARARARQRGPRADVSRLPVSPMTMGKRCP
jgi:hypothetical protein